MTRRGWAVGPATAGALLGALLAPATAIADPQADACYSAPVDGQTLQRAGKLLEARERFAGCARTSCPPEIVADCSRWLSDVEAATPSVVMAARDGEGHDVVDVRVVIDGRAPVDLSARAIPLDPGAHKLVFQRAGSADVSVDTLLREGEKNREVAVRFGVAPGAAGEPGSPRAGRPVPLAVWIAGGAGALGLASFATFGALGVSERGANHCDSGCTQGQKDAVDSKYLVANVSLGVGVVGLGVATWLYLARPAAEAPGAASIDVRPLPGGAFAAYGASF